MEVKSFVLGRDAVPEWFNESARQGRAKLVYDPDEQTELIGAVIFAPTKTINVKLGDTIMKSRTGLMVVPKDKAAKYMNPARKTQERQAGEK